jgi:hypothetical protein
MSGRFSPAGCNDLIEKPIYFDEFETVLLQYPED